MIDWLTINIPIANCALLKQFTHEPFGHVDYSQFNEHGLRTAAKDVFFEDGHWRCADLLHPWESVPSRHGGMAIKLVDATKISPAYLCIKGSPAKLVQGHNAFGSEDLQYCTFILIGLLVHTYGSLNDLLDMQNASFSRIDLTRSAYVGSPHQVKAVLDYLRPLSHRQTRKADGYESCVYFGSGLSTHKHLCVYGKEEEIRAELIKARKGTNQQRIAALELALEFSKNVIRFEARIKKDLIQKIFGTRKMLKVIEQFKDPSKPTELFNRAWKDIFDTFTAQDVVRSDKDVFDKLLALAETEQEIAGKKFTAGRAKAVYRTYTAIIDRGFAEATHKEIMSSSAKSEHLAALRAVGVSKAFLQQHQDANGTNVINMVRMVDIQPLDLKPEGYQPPSINEILAA